MPVQTAGFDHVHLWVGNVDTAVVFYREAFGAEVAFKVGERLVFVRLRSGEVIGLDGRPEPERSAGHFGLKLADGQDLDGAVGQVVQAGGSLLERSDHAPGVPYAYVADPDGNVIEL